jgi:hypothetical protein
MAPLSGDLIALLTTCGQVIEPNLQALHDEYSLGNFKMDEEEEAAGDDGER